MGKAKKIDLTLEAMVIALIIAVFTAPWSWWTPILWGTWTTFTVAVGRVLHIGWIKGGNKITKDTIMPFSKRMWKDVTVLVKKAASTTNSNSKSLRQRIIIKLYERYVRSNY